MNAALQTSFADLTGTLTELAQPVTLSDACNQIDRGVHTLTTLNVLMNCKPEDELTSVIRRLDTYISRQKKAAECHSPLYDCHYHMALVEQRRKLIAFIDNASATRAKLRELYQLINAEGGYAEPNDQYGQGKNDTILRVLQHLEAAGFGDGTSPFDPRSKQEAA